MEVTKKLTLEEILQAIEGLSEEEKAQVVEKAQGAQQEQQTDEIPEELPEEKQVEEKTEEPSVVPTEKTEDVEKEEEKEEIPEESLDPVPETPEEKPTEDTIPPQLTPEKEAEKQIPEEPTKEAVTPTNDVEKDNQAEMVKALTDRVTALEEANKTLSSALEEFKELKALMEEYTNKQADSFGYKGQIPGAKKDIKDMSADELKSHILQGK